jgi:hypothetical protein
MAKVVVRAADKAVLVRLCQDGLIDPVAIQRYEQARAATRVWRKASAPTAASARTSPDR